MSISIHVIKLWTHIHHALISSENGIFTNLYKSFVDQLQKLKVQVRISRKIPGCKEILFLTVLLATVQWFQNSLTNKQSKSRTFYKEKNSGGLRFRGESRIRWKWSIFSFQFIFILFLCYHYWNRFTRRCSFSIPVAQTMEHIFMQIISPMEICYVVQRS